ncbi:MAG: hypothetical protein IKN11_07715 [Bacteroidales bacterium]|nr:hypothetical protein [Bacteroidales bacterium]
MKKQIIPTTNPLGNGVTQWDDPNMVGPQVPDNVRDLYEETKTGGGFSWNNLVSHLGDIFGGIGSIVGNANSYSRTTDTTNRTVNETNGSFSFSNGTTLTVIILGGIAVIVTLILVLGKK